MRHPRSAQWRIVRHKHAKPTVYSWPYRKDGVYFLLYRRLITSKKWELEYYRYPQSDGSMSSKFKTVLAAIDWATRCSGVAKDEIALPKIPDDYKPTSTLDWY